MIRGLRRGALKMLFGLVSGIFILIFVLVATPGINQALTKYTPLDDVIQEQVAKRTQAYWEKQKAKATNQIVNDLKQKAGDQGSPLSEIGKRISADTQIPLSLLQTYLEQHAEQIYMKLPTLLREAYEKGQLKIQVTADQTTENIKDAVDQTGRSLADQAAVVITGWIMRAISFLLALVIAWIVTAIVAAVIDTASWRRFDPDLVSYVSGGNSLLDFPGGLLGRTNRGERCPENDQRIQSPDSAFPLRTS